MKLRTKTWMSAAAVSIPLLIASSVAAAATPVDVVEEVAGTIKAAAPSTETATQPDAASSASITFDAELVDPRTADSAQISIHVPVKAEDPIIIEATGAEPLEVSLPEEVTVDDAQLAADGTVVYTDDGEDAHAAVQALNDGSVRLQAILNSPDAPRTYTYDIGTTTPVLLEDGSVELTQELEEGVTAVVGTIDAPWATDANGASVDTWYTVNGNALIQHVAPSTDSAYPITADPRFSLGWGVYLHFSKAETRTIAASGWSPATLGGICAAAGFTLGPAGAAALGAACSAYAGAMVYTAGVAKNSSPERCLFVRYTGAGIILPGTYRDSRCK